MDKSSLDLLFNPQSIAVIGASQRPGSVGAVVLANLIRGKFPGLILPINPKYREIQGLRCYATLDDLPVAPHVAIIATPADTVISLIRQLGAKGGRYAIILSAGFGELAGNQGAAIQQALQNAATTAGVRLIGPNCIGVISSPSKANCSFAHIDPLPGSLAFVTQSGALLTSTMDWATQRGIGFSRLVSLGDTADIDCAEMLDYLAFDSATSAILLYIESITNARRFVSAARAASRIKPVIVLKVGRHHEAARAAKSHTGAMAGEDSVYDAAFRRAGMLRVHDLRDLFNAIETLSRIGTVPGDRLAIVTNGGGIGVMATDDLADEGGRLALLSDDTIERLDAVLPKTWSHANPVDIIGDAPGSRYQAALTVLQQADEVDAILALNCPTAVASSPEAAGAVASVAHASSKPLITSWLGAHSAQAAREIFEQHKIATYDTPSDAVRGFMHCVRYQKNQLLLAQTPPRHQVELAADAERTRQWLSALAADGERWLNEFESKRVLESYGITVNPSAFAASPEQAATIAKQLDGNVVLKIVSQDITHKSDVGGVMLNLASPEAVEKAAHDMLASCKKRAANAKIDGFTVQPMLNRRAGVELIVGIHDDAQFGPVVLFGQGGTAAERIADRAIALAPINVIVAQELMQRTRVYKLLQGYRDQPAANQQALEDVLIRLSQLATDCPEIAELDINPLLATPTQAIALDARILIKPPRLPGQTRLAIRPYPSEWSKTCSLPGLGQLCIRPIRPEDEPALIGAMDQLSPDEMRMRFLHPIKHLSHTLAARMTQIDYDREMAFIASPMDNLDQIYGAVHLVNEATPGHMEFALFVIHAQKGKGLGKALMDAMLTYAEQNNVSEIHGWVLHENEAMLHLCRKLGFEIRVTDNEPTTAHVIKRIG